MLAALDAANEFIRTRKADAAEIFARTSKTKVSKEEIVKILDDPDTVLHDPEQADESCGIHAPRRHNQGRAGEMVGHVHSAACRPKRQLKRPSSPKSVL